ncbi:hypothetical protein NDAWWUGD_CDS0103 [Salmonella phage SeKF_80]|uniref:Uncharacterized protein n=1 Tax=Salmonella phage 7-11 TaxID=1054968 RepID=G0X526_9CAUD|nr:hypothetical protein SaPh711_gp093 [Salmonella phage 7-11]AEK82008.1 hypothetical protein [Salmonella phage 7-11]
MTVDELIIKLENLSVTVGGDATVIVTNEDGDFSRELDRDDVSIDSITYDDSRERFIKIVI